MYYNMLKIPSNEINISHSGINILTLNVKIFL